MPDITRVAGNSHHPHPNFPPFQDHDRLEAFINEQGELFEMIVQRKPLPSILNAIVHWIEKQSACGLLASILLIDSTGQHLLHAAAPSLPPAYNEAIHGIKIGPSTGSCGTAAYTKNMVIVEDIAHDPLWKNFKDLALQFGLKACWSTPLLAKDGKVLGTFAVYYRHPHKPSPEELQLIKLVNRTTVIAIEYQLSEEVHMRLQANERKVFEQVKAEQQRLYKLLMKLPAALAVLRGPDHVYELVNAQYMETVGIDREVLGKPIKKAIPELKGQGIYELLDEVFRSGKTHTGREVLLKLNRGSGGSAEDAYFNFTYLPIRNEADQVEGILVHAAEVTDLVEARQQAEKSEQHFRNLIMEAPMATALYTGREMKIQLANEAMLKTWGKDASVIGKKLHEALPELKDQPFLRLLEEVYTSGEVYHTQEQSADLIVDGQLQTFWFNFTYKPLHDTNGDVFGILNMAVDVTGQVTARKLSEESESRFRMLADNMAQLAWMADENGNVFWFNKRWYDFTGIPSGDTQNNLRKHLVHPEHRERVLKKFNQATQAGEIWEDIFPMKSQAGEFHWFLSRSTPIKDKEGKVQRWFGTSTDITEQRRLQQQKDEFLAIASHELKTPITSIKAYAQMLENMFRNRGDIHEAMMLGKLDKQVNKLSSLIADLLDVTKIHAGKLQFNETVFDFNALAEEIIEEMERTSETHVIIKKFTETGNIYGDSERIGQVMINLISNAIKYSPHADRIVVSSAIKNSQVLFSVQDFGIGISKEESEKVFEQFYRAKMDKHQASGLGLGLYISSEIIKRQGGKIWVDSEKGKGSVFYFTLPRDHRNNVS